MFDQSSLSVASERYQKRCEAEGIYAHMSFAEYLDLVRKNPLVVRTAFQRVYDMIVSYGTCEYTEHKKTIIHYKFFDDPKYDGADAIYGLDSKLMLLVDAFHAASKGYGTQQ